MTPIRPDSLDVHPRSVLISIPNWVGDVVMATPALRAIRRRFPNAKIVHLMRPYVAEVLAGTGFGNEVVFWPTKHSSASTPVSFRVGDITLVRAGETPSLPCTKNRRWRITRGAGDDRLATGPAPTGYFDLVRRLRRESFDLAVLLTNSFRSALVARLAGVRRRVGYVRNGRGWLLTDRLAPRVRVTTSNSTLRDGTGRYQPVPALDYYNEMARYLGCTEIEDRMELATSRADEETLDRRLGPVDPARPLIVLNPGAHYGSAKCWPAEYFAELSDALVEQYDARVVASLTPSERPIADRLAAAARRPIEIFVDPPLGLGPLKALVRRSRLLITNDTGPRHFAAAFDVPVITIFGSSDPAWTDTRFAKERGVMLQLDCQPCMQRVCPLRHHNCMRELRPSRVLERVGELLGREAPVAGVCT